MPRSEVKQDASGKCLAVIPARGGSKRLPGKNIRDLLGKPVIAYTLEAALESGLFDRVVVSTDSAEVAEVARQWGGEVPFTRDINLADDFTPVSLVTLDALHRLDREGTRYRFVAQLMPNCPLRTVEDVRDSFGQFRDSRSESQISMTRYGWQNPWWAMRRTEEYQLQPLFEEQVTARSQDLPDLFCPTGAIWWAEAEVLRRHQTFHIAGRTGWEIPWQRAVDIDTADDWDMAEVLMRLAMSRDKDCGSRGD